MATPLTLQIVVDARRAKTGADEAKKGLRDVVVEGKRVEVQQDRVNRELNETGASGKRAKVGLDATERGLRGVGGASVLAVSGLRSIAAGLSAYTIGRQAIASYTEFEEAIARIEAVGGATGAELALLSDTARDVGRNTRYGASQAAAGLLELTKAGLDARQSIEGLRTALQFSTAGGLSTGESAETLVNIAAQFGLPAEQFSRIGNVLQKVSAATTTDIRDLSQALKDVGVNASQIGLSLEETVAALGVLGQRGLKGSDGAIKLRQAFAQMLDVTDDRAIATLDALGLGIADVDVRARGFEAVLNTLHDAQLDIVSSGRLVDSRNAAALVILAENTDHYRQLVKQTLSLDDALQKVSNTLDNTTSGAWAKFTNQLDSLNISIGEATGVGGPLDLLLQHWGNQAKALEALARAAEKARKGVKGLFDEAPVDFEQTVRPGYGGDGRLGTRSGYEVVRPGRPLPGQEGYVDPRARDIDPRAFASIPPGFPLDGFAPEPRPSRLLPPDYNAPIGPAYKVPPPDRRYFSSATMQWHDPDAEFQGPGIRDNDATRLPGADDLNKRFEEANRGVDMFAAGIGHLGATLVTSAGDFERAGQQIVQSIIAGMISDRLESVGRTIGNAVVNGLASSGKSDRQSREDSVRRGGGAGGF